MWSWLAGRVLRNRIGILTVVGVLTAFMGYEATKVQMNYKHGGLLPKSDPAYGEYEHFLKTFSADGNVIVVATQGKELYTPANFKQWYELGNDLKESPASTAYSARRTSSPWCATTASRSSTCES